MNYLRSIFFSVFLILISINPLQTEAISHDWVSAPRSKYGEQLWDKKNIIKNNDGSFRVFSKFIPKMKSDITQDILYTMDINCSEKTFRDVALGSKEFDEYSNINAKWKDPNGDKLILGVIDQVCNTNNP